MFCYIYKLHRYVLIYRRDLQRYRMNYMVTLFLHAMSRRCHRKSATSLSMYTVTDVVFKYKWNSGFPSNNFSRTPTLISPRDWIAERIVPFCVPVKKVKLSLSFEQGWRGGSQTHEPLKDPPLKCLCKILQREPNVPSGQMHLQANKHVSRCDSIWSP